MATEIDISSSNTQIPVGREKRRLRMIIKIILILLMIAVTVIPSMSVLILKTGTTTETMVNTTVSFITTVSTDITTISKTTTTSTTKPIVLQIFRRTNEVVYPTWNTTAGGDSSSSSLYQKIGSYWHTGPPEAALDGNLSSEYINHGICSPHGPLENECGIKTGFYVTFSSEPFILIKFCIATNIYSVDRDPNRITIEGSNNNKFDLVFGKSWTKIYDGDAGLAKDPGRRRYGNNQTIPNNSLPFRSYRILITLKKGKGTCVSYSEFEMTGRFPD